MKKKTSYKPARSDTTGEAIEFSASEQSSPAINNAVSKITKDKFPIIGIGASAGGLEALELFLKNVPPESGMAFIIVQHLDPTHKGILVELLQRATLMPVIQVTDRLMVKPNSVYVIPPNKDLSILHGALYLMAPSAPRGLRLPIDYFFRSLADDQGECSIGVILSGMGSDGTLGLRAIKEKAGVVFVQSPASAKFDGMPRSAIESGLADIVAAVEEIPGRITTYLHKSPVLIQDINNKESKNQSTLEKIFILLRTQTGHDFSMYKRTTIYRRIERRMGLHQINKITNYLRFLQENPQETELLFKELLIGVTNFFRDPAAWEQMKNEVFPMLLASHPEGGTLRAWTPGCSTGEEAYSLAMLFREMLEQTRVSEKYSLQIFATDLDHDAIDKARQGFYPANIAADVSSDRLHRFFTEEENGFRINKEIREMVVFAPQNLVMEPPFTRLDLLICRNLLIYLDPELQKKLIPLFYYCLNPGGVLFLGSAESIGTFNHLFTPLEGKLRFYQRLNITLQPDQIDFPSSFFSATPGSADNSISPPDIKTIAPSLQSLADQVLLQHFTPAAVLVNADGDILYVSGRTGKYLELAAGKVNWNIFAMAREGLRDELNSAFRKALREKTTVTIKNLIVGTNGGTQAIDLTIQPQKEPNALQGTILIVFSDTATPSATKLSNKNKTISSAQMLQLEQELQHLREQLHTTQEEMQTSQEELKSANEEMQSTNEELQSTNEELNTSKEEMQSMNEELQTVNQELQSKLLDLSTSNNDMKNLLNSTDIATLFLDENLYIRRYTSQAAKLIKLIPGDAGRPVTDIASDLIYPEMAEDTQEVLRSLNFIEKPVAARNGHWFIVRIMPYRTMENKIDGVVITFIDNTASKSLETTLNEALSVLQSRFTDQTLELDAAKTAEKLLQKAQSILEKRFTDQTAELHRIRVDLKTKKEGNS
jgi:two-component system CheB/CheR fusion protein